MQGDKTGGFTVFWADDGLDTGPVLLQKKTFVDPNDTVDSIYNRFLYPAGVKAMVKDYLCMCDLYFYSHAPLLRQLDINNRPLLKPCTLGPQHLLSLYICLANKTTPLLRPPLD